MDLSKKVVYDHYYLEKLIIKVDSNTPSQIENIEMTEPDEILAEVNNLKITSIIKTKILLNLLLKRPLII